VLDPESGECLKKLDTDLRRYDVVDDFMRFHNGVMPHSVVCDMIMKVAEEKNTMRSFVSRGATRESQNQPKLLDRLRLALRSRHYSKRTEQSYCHWVKRYIFFHNVTHPAEMGEAEINAFLTHLAVKKNVSASTQNQALSALLFLYRHVLGREVRDLGKVVRARKPERLPVVMSKDEVKSVLGHLAGEKWLIGSIMYGGGLRLMECLRLRVQDIDLQKNYKPYISPLFCDPSPRKRVRHKNDSGTAWS